ncbi:MAG: hypothetical protein HYZ50_23085 [Deltaproteobacteria bacterium]|nr:hypothetical protein [Deltaproteobacteria bacterium]
MNAFERKNTELIKEFNRYIREHPKCADQIPDEAIIVLQLERDRDFNAWVRRLADSRKSEGHPMVMVKITKLAPLRSRIEEIEVERVVHVGT